MELDYILYTASPENPYFVGELILPYLMANGIFTVTNFHRTFQKNYLCLYIPDNNNLIVLPWKFLFQINSFV